MTTPEQPQKQINLTDVPVNSENDALNLMVLFLQLIDDCNIFLMMQLN